MTTKSRNILIGCVLIATCASVPMIVMMTLPKHPAEWDELRVGMTRDEVKSVLGINYIHPAHGRDDYFTQSCNYLWMKYSWMLVLYFDLDVKLIKASGGGFLNRFAKFIYQKWELK